MKHVATLLLICFSTTCMGNKDHLEHRPCANILKNYMNAGTQFQNTLDALLNLLEAVDSTEYSPLIQKLKDIQTSTLAGNFQHDSMVQSMTDLKNTSPQPKWAKYFISRMSNQVSSMETRLIQWQRPNANEPQQENCLNSATYTCELGTPHGKCKYTSDYLGNTDIPKPPPSDYKFSETCEAIVDDYRKAAQDFTTLFDKVYALKDSEKYKEFSLALDVMQHTLKGGIYQHNILKPLIQTLKSIEPQPSQAKSLLGQLSDGSNGMHDSIQDWKKQNGQYDGRRCRAMWGCLLGTPDTPCSAQ